MPEHVAYLPPPSKRASDARRRRMRLRQRIERRHDRPWAQRAARRLRRSLTVTRIGGGLRVVRRMRAGGLLFRSQVRRLLAIKAIAMRSTIALLPWTGDFKQVLRRRRLRPMRRKRRTERPKTNRASVLCRFGLATSRTAEAARDAKGASTHGFTAGEGFAAASGKGKLPFRAAAAQGLCFECGELREDASKCYCPRRDTAARAGPPAPSPSSSGDRRSAKMW